jgi:trans-aconitate methyltransferase
MFGKKSKKNYSWNAQEYAKHSSSQQKWAQELIAKLHLNGTETILDIGCGEGKVTAEIALNVPDGKVIGIDSSLNMITNAKSNYLPSKYSNLSFFLMDALDISFKDQFDIIFSNAALHWIKDHQRVLKNVKKALKKSGRILFQMGGMGNADEMISALNQTVKKVKWEKYFLNLTFPYSFYGPEEYSMWLKEVNLEIVRLKLIPKMMEHPGKESLKGWIRTTWLPYTERVPETLREKLIEEISECYLLEHPQTGSDKISVKMMRLEVEALNR